MCKRGLISNETWILIIVLLIVIFILFWSYRPLILNFGSSNGKPSDVLPSNIKNNTPLSNEKTNNNFSSNIKQNNISSLDEKQNISAFPNKFQASIENFYDNGSEKYITLLVKDSGGIDELAGVRISLEDKGGSSFFISNTSLNSLSSGSSIVFFNFSSSKIGNVSKILIYPIYVNSKGFSFIGAPIKKDDLNFYSSDSGNSTPSECSDRIDNDGDGLIDYPVDPGCSSSFGNETGNFKREKTWAYAWVSLEGSFGNVVPMARIASMDDVDKVVNELSKQPEGHHAIIISRSFYDDLTKNKSDYCNVPDSNETVSCLWWDNGVAATKKKFDGLFGELKSKGAKVNYVILDTEYGFSNWALGAHESTLSDRWNAIYADPRFKNKIVPEMREIDPSIDFTGSYEDLIKVSDGWGSDRNYTNSWNDLMEKRVANYINNATYEEVVKYYPNVKMSDYGLSNHSMKFISYDYNGWPTMFGTGAVVGTDQAPSLYGTLGQTAQKKFDGKVYGKSPFKSLKLYVNKMRSKKLSSNVPVMPWFPPKSWQDSILSGSDYYQELLLHTALTNPDVFLYWDSYTYKGPNDDAILSNTLNEFDGIAGFSDKRTLVDNFSNWTNDYVLTGIYSGGRNVYRFTPEISEKSSLKDFLVRNDSSGVEFKTNDSTIFIPEGIIYSPKNPVSSYGYWIVQPANASDVEVKDF